MPYAQSKLILEGATSNSKKINYVYELVARNIFVADCIFATDFERSEDDHRIAKTLHHSKIKMFDSEYVDYTLYQEEVGLNLCAFMDEVRRSEPVYKAWATAKLRLVPYPKYPHMDDTFLRCSNVDQLNRYLNKTLSRLATILSCHQYLRYFPECRNYLTSAELGYETTDYATDNIGVLRDEETLTPIINNWEERYEFYRECHMGIIAANPLLDHRMDSAHVTQQERLKVDIERQQWIAYHRPHGSKFGNPEKSSRFRPSKVTKSLKDMALNNGRAIFKRFPSIVKPTKKLTEELDESRVEHPASPIQTTSPTHPATPTPEWEPHDWTAFEAAQNWPKWVIDTDEGTKENPIIITDSPSPMENVTNEPDEDAHSDITEEAHESGFTKILLRSPIRHEQRIYDYCDESNLIDLDDDQESQLDSLA